MLRRLAVLGLFALASLLLGSPQAVRAQDALIPLQVGLGDVSLTKLIFLVANDAGIYAKDGLAVQQFISPRAAEVARRSGVIGREDAFVGDEIVQAMAAKLGYRDLLDLSVYHIPLAGSGINASRTWLRDHRDVAARFVKATVDALALVKTNKAVAFASLAKWYNITDPEQQERIYRQIADLPRKPYPAVDGIKEVMAIYRYREMQIHRPEDFYDDSFVRALDQSGYIDGLYKNSSAL